MINDKSCQVKTHDTDYMRRKMQTDRVTSVFNEPYFRQNETHLGASK